MTHRLALLLSAAVLWSCGGDAEKPAAGAKPKPASTPRADGIDAVAERVMDEIPGCAPDVTHPVTPEMEKDGVVAVRTGICEDEILEGMIVYEFEDPEAAEGLRQAYWLIDDPKAKDGEVVVNGKVFCSEEFKGDKDSVTCMLVVGKYILIADGKTGRDTAAVMDQRMGAFARAAE